MITMQWNMQNSARLAKFTRISYTNPQSYFTLTVTSWLFEAWGIEVIGPISPLSTRGHRFILTITDYFSKWVKAIPLAEIKTISIINFIKHHVIHLFGVPRRIIHDNGPQFVSQSFFRFYDKYRIQNVALTASTLSLMGWQRH